MELAVPPKDCIVEMECYARCRESKSLAQRTYVHIVIQITWTDYSDYNKTFHNASLQIFLSKPSIVKSLQSVALQRKCQVNC